MKDHAMQAIETIEKLYERKGSITGISTGFVEFDRMTSGLHPSEMVVIAARPSMGKTALAMNIAEFVAISEKLPVGVFSLEMSSQQLVQRLLCSRARVNLHLPPESANAFYALAKRRRDGEPVAQLTGVREFWGLVLRVTPDVLIPRPETETLVELALSLRQPIGP